MGQVEEEALDIRTTYIAMAGCTATIDLTADYGQRVYDYTLSLVYEKEGDTTLTVVQPESVAGITARMHGKDTWLEFDGKSLETGPMDGKGMSPISAVPILLEAIQSGYLAEVEAITLDEVEGLRLCCRDPELTPGVGQEINLWFDRESKALLAAELLSDGYRVIQCTVKDFTITPSGA